MSYSFRPTGGDRFNPYSDTRGRGGRDPSPPRNTPYAAQESAPAGGIDYDFEGKPYPFTTYSTDEEFQRSRSARSPSPVYEEWQSSRSPSPPRSRRRAPIPGREPSPYSAQPAYGVRRASPLRNYEPRHSSRRSPYTQEYRTSGDVDFDRILEANANETVENLMRAGYTFQDARAVVELELDEELETIRSNRGRAQSRRNDFPRDQRGSGYSPGPPQDPRDDRYGGRPRRGRDAEDFTVVKSSPQ